MDDRVLRGGHSKTAGAADAGGWSDAFAAGLSMPRRLMAKFRVAGLSNVEELAAKFDVSVPARKLTLVG
jgi:hypothetical protein